MGANIPDFNSQGEALSHLGKGFGVADEKLVKRAHELYAAPSDNDVEIAETPLVSEGEDGTWVLAWVFVPKEESETA